MNIVNVIKGNTRILKIISISITGFLLLVLTIFSYILFTKKSADQLNNDSNANVLSPEPTPQSHFEKIEINWDNFNIQVPAEIKNIINDAAKKYEEVNSITYVIETSTPSGVVLSLYYVDFLKQKSAAYQLGNEEGSDWYDEIIKIGPDKEYTSLMGLNTDFKETIFTSKDKLVNGMLDYIFNTDESQNLNENGNIQFNIKENTEIPYLFFNDFVDKSYIIDNFKIKNYSNITKENGTAIILSNKDGYNPTDGDFKANTVWIDNEGYLKQVNSNFWWPEYYIIGINDNIDISIPENTQIREVDTSLISALEKIINTQKISMLHSAEDCMYYDDTKEELIFIDEDIENKKEITMEWNKYNHLEFLQEFSRLVINKSDNTEFSNLVSMDIKSQSDTYTIANNNIPVKKYSGHVEYTSPWLGKVPISFAGYVNFPLDFEIILDKSQVNIIKMSFSNGKPNGCNGEYTFDKISYGDIKAPISSPIQ